MAKKNDRDSLGYLGIDFQYRLAKAFMEDKKFFISINTIVNQNMFTEPNLRTYIGVLKEYYEKYELVPSYSIMETELRYKAHDDMDRDFLMETLKKIHDTSTEGIESIHEKADKFFKQQNIVRVANEILKIASDGDVEKYSQCVDLLQKAMEVGSDDDMGISVFDNMDEVLSDEYRIVVPTGVGKIDETLEGGLGKGELGIIIGPSSFGKVQPNDAKIVTPNGYVNMGDIRIGDYVIGKNGKPTKVIGVYPHKNWQFYKIEFSDGVSTECGKEHLWHVNSYNQRCHNNDSFITLSLGDIVDNGLYVDNNGISTYNYKIPICEPINFEDVSLDIEPYDMGCLLGDSKSKNGVIPNEYLFNSLSKRIDLLNGLMHNNNFYDDNGKTRFKTRSNSLSNDVRQLVLSLGGFSNIIKISENEYNVTIELCDHSSLKSINFLNDIPKRLNERFITKVEISRVCDGQCIKVEADDELYLTDDFIVTHNTSLTTAMACHAATCKTETNGYKGFKVLQIVFEDRPKQIQRKYFGRITNVEAKDLSKSAYVEQVKKTLTEYEDREMLKNNVRIKRFPSGEVSATQVFAFIKKLINSGFRPDMVIGDYFECLKLEKGRDTSDDTWTKEGYTMRKLESMAGDLDIALWVTTQGTRDSLGAEIVTMDKAGGSFKKIQIGHIIMSIARTMEDIATCKATMAILKNRAGAAGKVFNNVEFNNGTCRISTDNVDEYNTMADFNSVKKENQTKDMYNTARECLNKQILTT